MFFYNYECEIKHNSLEWFCTIMKELLWNSSPLKQSFSESEINFVGLVQCRLSWYPSLSWKNSFSIILNMKSNILFLTDFVECWRNCVKTGIVVVWEQKHWQVRLELHILYWGVSNEIFLIELFLVFCHLKPSFFIHFWSFCHLRMTK